MIYKCEDEIKFLYDGFIVQGTVLSVSGIIDSESLIVAINTTEQNLIELLTAKNIHKIDKALLRCFDATVSLANKQPCSVAYQKYLGHFYLEIFEKDIIDKRWKPVGWEGWIIKDT